MQGRIFQRYVWLVNTISSAGRISMEEINRKWATSSLNDMHEQAYPRFSFMRHKEDIAECFGLEIAYDRRQNAYYIANYDDVKQGKMSEWMMNNFAISNMLSESRTLDNRILLEQIPSGTNYLPLIISAMRDSKVLQVTHQSFGKDERTFLLEPYCLKVFKQRWYVYGHPQDKPKERRIYALDRIVRIEETDAKFRLPKNFDAEREFEDYYGVFTNKPAERVCIRVASDTAFFLRSLPLHHSQQEVLTTADYSEFEYLVAPTFDFVQQLRTHGSKLEVLSPEWLRTDMREEAKKLLLRYEAEQ